MKIAPIDIAHKTFGRKMFGIDPEEVHEFLRSVAEVMEDIIRERNQLKEGLREKELQVLEYRERDEVLKNTITMATKMSEKIRQDSEREGSLIVNDANQKADIIIRDARESLKKTYEELANLKRVRMQFEANLRALATAHISLIEQSDKYIPSIPVDGSQQNQGKRPPVATA